MRVPLSWLRDYVDIDRSPAELAEALTESGLEVAGIETSGAGWTDVVVGAVLPGERRIERSRIRGVVSNGMLCSAIELGTGADADGIQILGTNHEYQLGSPVAEILGETVLDVDVKPNRGDALSMVGLGREVAAITGGELRLPRIDLVESDEPVESHL